MRKGALLLLTLIPAFLIGLQELPPAARGVRIVDIVAAVPEAGGFQPDSITVYAGQRVRLRFRAADTTHGVAIGPGLGIDLGDLAPGEVKTVDVTFPTAGTYTFYCNKWCSPNHWRMRGVIAVDQPRSPAPAHQRDPVVEALAADGVDIDAYLAEGAGTVHAGQDLAHAQDPLSAAADAQVAARQPSAAAGAAQLSAIAVPAELQNVEWRRRHAPLEAEAILLAANPHADPAALADVVAFLWLGRPQIDLLVTPPEPAATLYAKNCAACHGNKGDGQGFDAASSPAPPPAFDDPQRMGARRSDVLYAKIRRGGMGTGMPNYGTLFTPEETWALVDYLWRLAYHR